MNYLLRNERAALVSLSEGSAIARPIRRRLEKAGLVIDGQVSPLGIHALVSTAPSSKWTPPKQPRISATGMDSSTVTVDQIVTRSPRSQATLYALAMAALLPGNRR